MEELKLEPSVGLFIRSAPNLISRGAELLDTKDEQIMGIFASTAIIGALMPRVWFNYDNKVSNPQIYVAIIKPPGSGKGKLSLYQRLLNKIDTFLLTKNNEANRRYNIQMKIYEKKLKNPVDGEELVIPEKPSLKLLSVPGNTTSSMLIQQIAENNGEMVVFIMETEIDGLTNMMGNLKFGGDNSMIFRKGFHNETISQMRKGNSEHLVATNPKLSILITGTPFQVGQLFKSNKDGSFSRYAICTSNTEDKWKDIKPCEDCHPLDESFDKLGEVYYAVFHHFANRELEVKFTDEQWEAMNSYGNSWHKISDEVGGENATSIAKRHINMMARVATAYTAIRSFEEKNDSNCITCNDIDFLNAFWLIEQSFQNALSLFKELPGEKSQKNSDDEIFDSLPESFKRAELAPLQAKLMISEKSINRKLTKWVEEKKMLNPRKGYYEKIGMSHLSDVPLSN
jgi:hypothetical protein